MCVLKMAWRRRMCMETFVYLFLRASLMLIMFFKFAFRSLCIFLKPIFSLSGRPGVPFFRIIRGPGKEFIVYKSFVCERTFLLIYIFPESRVCPPPTIQSTEWPDFRVPISHTLQCSWFFSLLPSCTDVHFSLSLGITPGL